LTDEIKAMLEELKSEAASGTPSIEVIYKEGYGRQSNVSDSSEEESKNYRNFYVYRMNKNDSKTSQ